MMNMRICALAQQGKLFRPNLSRLLPATYHFNPTIIMWSGSIWMIYRCVTSQKGLSLFEWPRTIALCRVGPKLQPLIESNVDLSARIVDPLGAKRWHADPRFFIHKDCPWVLYHDNWDLYAFPLVPDDVPERISPYHLVLVDRLRRRTERNWGLFDDGVFKAVYSIHPHVVLQLDDSGDELLARTLVETEAVIPWDIRLWGDPHGGSSPIRVGSYWFSFFQSSIRVGRLSKKKLYRMGFYGFDAKPPHRIRFMTRQPILSAESIEGTRSYYRNHAVVFPSGALYDNGWWMVSLGMHDRTLAFAFFEHNQLLKDCVILS